MNAIGIAEIEREWNLQRAKIYSREVLVTPEMAKKILETQNKSNRKLIKSDVDKYALDMSSGNFVGGTCISFFQDGSLADGQHRLHAVVQSGVAILFVFVFNIDEKAKLVLNLGRKQQAWHNLQMMHGCDRIYGGNIKTVSGAIRNIYSIERNVTSLTPSQSMEKIDLFKDGIFCVSDYINGKQKGLTRYPVWAALISASYYVSHKTIKRFCELLFGKTNADFAYECLPIRFATFLVGIGKRASGHAVDREIFFKTQRALKAFVEKQDIKNIYSNGVIYCGTDVVDSKKGSNNE